MRFIITDNSIIDVHDTDIMLRLPIPTSREGRFLTDEEKKDKFRVLIEPRNGKTAFSIYVGSQSDCQNFIAALGEVLNTGIEAVPVELIEETMLSLVRKRANNGNEQM